MKTKTWGQCSIQGCIVWLLCWTEFQVYFSGLFSPRWHFNPFFNLAAE